MRFRGWLYGLAMAQRGKNFQVAHDAIIRDLENIKMGGGNFVGNQVIIFCGGELLIGSNVQIGPQTVITPSNHTSIKGSYSKGFPERGIIIIGDGAWVGAHCTLLKGAVLPSNSVLAANSLLNKAFDISDSIYGGSPAHLLKTNKPFT